MSDTTPDPAALAWAALPRQAQIRQATVAVLAAAATLAGTRVADTPLEDWTDADLPAIAVYSSMDRAPRSQAGTAPRFQVTMTLRIQAEVNAAVPADAIARLDQLEQQIPDALFADSVWLGLAGPLGGIQTKRGYAREGELPRGQIMHSILISWFETYAITNTSPLLLGGQPIGVPTATRLAIEPLTTAKITTAEPAGTPETVLQIPLPQPD